MNVQKRMVTRKLLPPKGIEFNKSGSDMKAIYQISHFDLRKQRKNLKKCHLLRETKTKFGMDRKLCPGIHPSSKFSPPPPALFQGKPPV